MISRIRLFITHSLKIHQLGWSEVRGTGLNNYSKMPKSKKTSSKQKNKTETTGTQGAGSLSSPEEAAITILKDGRIAIKVLAKPGAKHNGITDISDEGVGVQIAAPPVDGEANTELIKYLSKILNLRKSDVTLEKGSKSRAKTVAVSSGTLNIEEVHQRLQKEKDT